MPPRSYKPYSRAYAASAYKPYSSSARNKAKELGRIQTDWDTVPLSPPPPAYSAVEREKMDERGRKKKKKTERVVSSFYGDEGGGGGGGHGVSPDRMSILSFIGYYEYYQPEEKRW
jgi:hypothetical protein